MPLVEYSDSEDEPSSSERPLKKAKAKHHLPPLPPSFRDLYASSVRTAVKDDPALHGGRKRVTPHVDGTWPSHVYIEWCPDTVEFEQLESLVARCIDSDATASGLPTADAECTTPTTSLLQSPLGAPLPLHISLSPCLTIPTAHKDTLLSGLQSTIQHSSISPFDLWLSSSHLRWEPNFERTRYFLVIGMDTPLGDELKGLLGLVNSVVQRLGYRALYDGDGVDGRFHVSLAWRLTSPTQRMEEALSDVVDERPGVGMEINVKNLKVKIGNVVTSMELSGGVAGHQQERKKGVLGI